MPGRPVLVCAAPLWQPRGPMDGAEGAKCGAYTVEQAVRAVGKLLTEPWQG